MDNAVSHKPKLLHFLLRTLLSLLGGACITLSLSPIDIWPLAFVAPALLYFTLYQQTAKQAAYQGWIFGLGLYASGASWVFVSIYHHSDTPFWLAFMMTGLFVAALALCFALHGWVIGKLFSKSRFYALGFIGLWVLSEWFRSWFLTGFPWLFSGYALLDTPLNTWAPIGGVWLLSFGVVFIAVALLKIALIKIALIKNIRTELLSTTTATRAKATREKATGKKAARRGANRPGTTNVLWALGISLFALPPLFLPKVWTEAISTQDVNIVQANIPQHLKWNSNYLAEILNSYTDTTEKRTSASIVIWPETAIPTFLQNAMPYLIPTLEQLEAEDRTLVSGHPGIAQDKTHPDGRRIHNSLSVLTADGQALYAKQRLVPFGEYVPLESYLRGLFDFFNLPMSGFSLPQEPQQPIRVRDGLVAAAICYEIAYPELVSSLAEQSHWILTLSNDTWFSHSLAPAQHLQIARMRALENNRWVVRSTNNGITALINPQGIIAAQAPAYTKAVLSGTIELREGQTPYQKWGIWPLLALCFGLVLASIYGQRSNKLPI